VPYYNGYLSAKTALTRLTEGLAMETAEHDLAVFSVFPGSVDTAMLAEVRASPWLPRVAAMMGWKGGSLTPPEAAAQLCVVLASGRADRLFGRHLSMQDDIEALIAQADTVVADDRYVLRLRA
jgi:NAD(P)-dependent dehydrogenase (short-subunit alcohol dehydrogenase family)